MDQERMVYERYKKASQIKDLTLCCPTKYDNELLKIIPQEIIEKDYGCGDPSAYILEGETVLDLGSGGGKLVYIIAQIVGKEGKVIGVDMNTEMLNLARKYENHLAEKLGYKNFEFRRGRIQNLRLDLEKLENYLKENPIRNIEDYINLEFTIRELERESPLIKNDSIDVVVSNCVLNLVRDEDKKELFREIYRVLKKNGRAVISDIVSDKKVPPYLKEDPELWSGCISGALEEKDFINAFREAGFKDVVVIKKESEPWRVVEDINFFSITVSAYKGEKIVKYFDCCGNNNVYVSFEENIRKNKIELKKEEIRVIQINVGGVCNQTCSHCHLSANPYDNRVMELVTMERLFQLIDINKYEIIDITGGAPELNPHISFLLDKAKEYFPKIIFRTNLTALLVREELLERLSDSRVALYVSFPSFDMTEFERQRGKGSFEDSIKMLKKLNRIGFGEKFELNIVYNPVNFELPSEESYQKFEKALKSDLGIKFNKLISITNVPLGRFEENLKLSNLYDKYMFLLASNFNRENIKGLMCKNLVNIGFDGTIYDCDFNNASGLKVSHINKIGSFEELKGRKIITSEYCYACTAKRGSSCFGSISL
ncbi:MAG: arsenosugar biosynthesis radical SAM protein ArsS [Proteobacteria bacterium]|nr:arsenosugar biosynthesis radical SAM protein ArsS [Pseudomonadota bacterium]